GLSEERQSSTFSGDFQQYIYAPTNALVGLLKQFAASGEAAWSKLANTLNAKSANELESISTVLYLMRHGFSGEALKQQFNQLKPHLMEHMDKSISFAGMISNAVR